MSAFGDKADIAIGHGHNFYLSRSYTIL
jgi:hypothetical protein